MSIEQSIRDIKAVKREIKVIKKRSVDTDGRRAHNSPMDWNLMEKRVTSAKGQESSLVRDLIRAVAKIEARLVELEKLTTE